MRSPRLITLLVLLFVPFDSQLSAQAPITHAQGKRPMQAVIETTAGTIVLDLLADRAPNHVALFIKIGRASCRERV